MWVPEGVLSLTRRLSDVIYQALDADADRLPDIQCLAA